MIAQDLYSKAYILGEISKTVKRTSRMIEKMGDNPGDTKLPEHNIEIQQSK